MPKRVLKGKLYVARRRGRPRIRWPEYVIADLRRMGISGWMDGWIRREIGIIEGGSLRRPRPTQGCSAEKKKKKYVHHLEDNIVHAALCAMFFMHLYKRSRRLKEVLDINT